jgi:hypothetical protein
VDDCAPYLGLTKRCSEPLARTAFPFSMTFPSTCSDAGSRRR